MVSELENGPDDKRDYLIPDITIRFSCENEEDEDEEYPDELTHQINLREEFVMKVLYSMEQQGLKDSPPYLQYQTELYSLLALENQHLALIEHESMDDEEENDDNDDGTQTV